MSPVFLLQMISLLFLGQLLLGGIGWLLVGAAPWAGLPATLLLVWFIRRTALVFREETAKVARRDRTVKPARLALLVALVVQLPGLALLPYWAPDWITLLWQGAVLPVAAALSALWPVLRDPLGAWLWVAAFVEMALFAWIAIPLERKVSLAPASPAKAAPVKAAPGEWVPARRVADVNRRGRRVR